MPATTSLVQKAWAFCILPHPSARSTPSPQPASSAMSDQPQHSIPSLVGGFPTKADFAPSIIFAIAYGLSVIPFLIRFLNPNTRTWTFAIGTFAYSVERVVVWSIRASQSHDHHLGETLSKGRLVYQQVSFALGFIGFGTDCVAFMRATLVNTTLEDPKRGSVDNARARFWSRRATDLAGLLWMISSVPGAVGYSKMPGSFDHPENADKLFSLRSGLFFRQCSISSNVLTQDPVFHYQIRKRVDSTLLVRLLHRSSPLHPQPH